MMVISGQKLGHPFHIGDGAGKRHTLYPYLGGFSSADWGRRQLLRDVVPALARYLLMAQLNLSV